MVKRITIDPLLELRLVLGEGTMKVTIQMNERELNRLRMLADWQVREEGFNPDEITRLCQEQDELERRNGNRFGQLKHGDKS